VLVQDLAPCSASVSTHVGDDPPTPCLFVGEGHDLGGWLATGPEEVGDDG
jgi:hypothetical protein